MKKILVAILLSSIAMPAFAADLSYKKPEAKMPIMAQTKNWTGFYGGISAGAGQNKSNIDDVDCYNCASGNFTNYFGAAGGQIGYNYQYRSFVVGLEGDALYSSSNKKGNMWIGDLPFRIKNDVVLGLRPRIGLAFEDTLIYATAGISFSHMDINATCISSDNSGCKIGDSWKHKKWYSGFVIGAGVETKLTANISVKAEWLTTQLENKYREVSPANNDKSRLGFGGTNNMVKVGLNYNFGSPF